MLTLEPTKATLRRYSVRVSGFDAEGTPRVARSASAARYAVFRDMIEAGYRIDFKEFLTRVSTLYLGVQL